MLIFAFKTMTSLLLALCLIFIAGCAGQLNDEVVEEEPVEEAEEIEEEQGNDDIADQVDEIYLDMEGPLAPRITGASERKTAAPLSPDLGHLLGSYRDTLKLYKYPGQELVKTYKFDDSLDLLHYSWHPSGDAFVLFAEANTEVHIYLVDLGGEKRNVISFDRAKHGTSRIDLKGMDFRVGFIEWALQGEAIALDLHTEDYSSIKLIDLDGELLLEEQWEDRSHLRSPLTDPGGRKIAFTRFGGAGENLWIWDLESGDLSQVTEGSGDYPFIWLEHNQLIVITGGIGPGGGQHYGLALIDLESGERMWEYSVRDKRNLFSPTAILPDGSLAFGTETDGAGTDARVSMVDLQKKEQEYILEDFRLRQAEWVKDDLVVLNLSGWKDPEEAYEGRENYHVLKGYSLKEGLATLAESEKQLYLLGVYDGEVHYLKSAEDKDHWTWQYVKLEGEFE